MPWNPDDYHKFQNERFAPFEDLIKLVKVREGLRVVDLGCGTGELTCRLADLLPDSTVVVWTRRKGCSPALNPLHAKA